MSLRKVINVAYAYLMEIGSSIQLTQRGRKVEMTVDEWLNQPLVPDAESERKRRAKANQAGQQVLMAALGKARR